MNQHKRRSVCAIEERPHVYSILYKLSQVNQNGERYGVVYYRIRHKNGLFSARYDRERVRKITVFICSRMSNITGVSICSVNDGTRHRIRSNTKAVNATFYVIWRASFNRILLQYFQVYVCCAISGSLTHFLLTLTLSFSTTLLPWPDLDQVDINIHSTIADSNKIFIDNWNIMTKISMWRTNRDWKTIFLNLTKHQQHFIFKWISIIPKRRRWWLLFSHGLSNSNDRFDPFECDIHISSIQLRPIDFLD